MEGLKLLFVFSLIIFLLWKRKPLAFALLCGSVALGVLFRSGLKDLAQMVWDGTTNRGTIDLVFILISIMVFEYLIREQGYLERMLESLKVLIRQPRIILAILPAFIGLMPSAGGALFSAPLVEQAASGTNITSEQKSFVNFYYRHTSEYFLPIYSSVLLISQVSGISLSQLIPALAPYGIMVILFGIPTLLKFPVIKIEESIQLDRWKAGKNFLFNALPILVILLLVVIFQIEVGIAVGLVVTLLLIFHRYTPAKFYLLCREAVNTKTILLVFAIMIFKQVLTDTHAINVLPSLLIKLPVPQYVVFGLVSFLVGSLTGLLIASIAITFPLVIGVMGAEFSLSMVIFLFISGFTGTMLTPMHLCLTLTLDFFKADLKKVLRMLIVPEMLLMVTAFIMYLLA